MCLNNTVSELFALLFTFFFPPNRTDIFSSTQSENLFIYLTCSHSSLSHYMQIHYVCVQWCRVKKQPEEELGSPSALRYLPLSEADAVHQGQKQVTAAKDVRPHTRITVTEPESLGGATFLWSRAGNAKEYIRSLEGCVAGVPLCITLYLYTLPRATKRLPENPWKTCERQSSKKL